MRRVEMVPPEEGVVRLPYEWAAEAFESGEWIRLETAFSVGRDGTVYWDHIQLLKYLPPSRSRRMWERFGVVISEADDGLTWLGALLDRVGLHGLSTALGLGRHSDKQLLAWACARERDWESRSKQLTWRLHRDDPEEAARIMRSWPHQ